MLITLAITILLAKAVLLTKDIAVCVPLDSKVQGVRNPCHIEPVVSSCSLQFYTQLLKAPVKVKVRFFFK